MQKRLVAAIGRLLFLLGIGIAYFLLNTLAGFEIPCLFNKVTGYLCPACGITRMVKAAARLDFAAAYSYNKLLFVTWPLAAIPLVQGEVQYIRSGKWDMGRWEILLWIEIGLLLLFGIIRNIT